MPAGCGQPARGDWRAAYRGRPVVVLGASGFIGRWVARLLRECGAVVHVVVRDREAAGPVFARYGIEGIVHECDLSAPEAVWKVFAPIRPAVAFNLVGYGVHAGEQDETRSFAINVTAVGALCEALARSPRDDVWRGQDIVHAGSALEYGTVGGNLAEDGPARPDTLYGRTKLAGTRALADACRTLGLNGVTARLFTVYGPGERPGRLLPTLVQAARMGTRVPLTAGHQRRDFIYVADTAEALLRLGLSEAPGGAVVNVATGRLSSVREFVETAADILGIPRDALELGALPTRPEEMEHSAVDLRRLQSMTGWVPATTIAEGIKRALAFESWVGG